MGEIGSNNFESEPPREPFDLKEGSASFETRTTLRELKDNPDKIVREEPMINDSIDESISHYANLKRMYEQMRDRYGVNIPDIDMVIGEKKKGERKVFMVVDKIEGQDMEKLYSLPADKKERFETFYLGILRSMVDSYKEEKPFFYDNHQGNIMYGHKSKDENKQDNFFLADVGKEGFTYKAQGTSGDPNVRKYDIDFFDVLHHLAKFEVREYERKFGENVILHDIRSKLRETYEYFKINKVEEFNKMPAEKVACLESFLEEINN